MPAFCARWIVPVEGEPVENGRVVVEDGRIAVVERNRPLASSTIDFGDAVILPGFVNSHTHLELTCCHQRVPYRGSFVDWIEQVTSLNPHRVGGDWVEQSVRDGLARSLAAGVTAIGDIGHGPHVLECWRRAELHTVGFLEVIGIGAKFKSMSVADRSMWAVSELCARTDPDPGSSLHRIGVTPHAPYSTDEEIYRDAIAFAADARRPICTHLAETRDEWTFLAEGTGGFRDLFERMGLWDRTFRPPRCSPVEYARRIGLLDVGPLLAHVNYVTDSDLDLLAASPCSVAYCPRTHHFFQHEPHRYRDMLARGINVCIGTDSLASNDTLSILDELRFLRRRDTAISGNGVLALGTIAGARALGWKDEIGSLAPGKRADFIVVPLSEPNAADPVEDVLYGDASPTAVYLNGNRAF